MRTRLSSKIFLLVITLFSLCSIAPISKFDSVLSSGGGTTYGSRFKLESTIGQPAVGRVMRGGQFSIIEGFWSFAYMIPDVTKLCIQVTNNIVFVSWGYDSQLDLESNVNLSNPYGWEKVPFEILTSGDVSYVIHPADGRQRFYRLCSE